MQIFFAKSLRKSPAKGPCVNRCQHGILSLVGPEAKKDWIRAGDSIPVRWEGLEMDYCLNEYQENKEIKETIVKNNGYVARYSYGKGVTEIIEKLIKLGS